MTTHHSGGDIGPPRPGVLDHVEQQFADELVEKHTDRIVRHENGCGLDSHRQFVLLVHPLAEPAEEVAEVFAPE